MTFDNHMKQITWGRYGGYEVSTRGDRRFSAFVATLPDGRSIEQHYQCDAKEHDPGGRNWRLGKGKPPKRDISQQELYLEYLSLWTAWAHAHNDLMCELRDAASLNGHSLSDRFATSPINQARALADLLNMGFGVRDD